MHETCNPPGQARRLADGASETEPTGDAGAAPKPRVWPTWLRLTIIAAALLVPPGLVVLYSFKPTEHSFYPRCLWHYATKTHCPGCGTARALHALLHGQLLQAVTYNLPILFLLPIFLYWGWCIGYGMWRDEPAEIPLTPSWLLRIVLIFMILYWVLRNIPVYPFNVLAPHEL